MEESTASEINVIGDRACRVEVVEPEFARSGITTSLFAVINEDLDGWIVEKGNEGGFIGINDNIRIVEDETAQSHPIRRESPCHYIFFLDFMVSTRLLENL